MTPLGNLHNKISQCAYWLHVLVFHTCLYNFPILTDSHFLGELRFKNDALQKSSDYGNLVKVP